MRRAMPRRGWGVFLARLGSAARLRRRISSVFVITYRSSRNLRGRADWRPVGLIGGRASDWRSTNMCRGAYAAGKRACGVSSLTIRRCHLISVGHIGLMMSG